MLFLDIGGLDIGGSYIDGFCLLFMTAERWSTSKLLMLIGARTLNSINMM